MTEAVETWKEGWFSKRCSEHEGLYTWSLLVAAVNPHIFNSGESCVRFIQFPHRLCYLHSQTDIIFSEVTYPFYIAYRTAIG
jgi:hypothetical protein